MEENSLKCGSSSTSTNHGISSHIGLGSVEAHLGPKLECGDARGDRKTVVLLISLQAKIIPFRVEHISPLGLSGGQGTTTQPSDPMALDSVSW